MRTTFSILLIVLLLLNVLGYYGVFLGLQYKNAQDFTSRLDAEDYTEEETFTIKVPLVVPYHTDDQQYERVNGEIEHKGEFFRLVKQKLSKDTLYIVCIKDHTGKNIKKALSDYVKTFSDKPADANHQSKTVPSFIKDFLSIEISLMSSVHGWIHTINFPQGNETFSSLFLTITTPPPRA